MKGFLIGLGVFLSLLIIGLCIFFFATPTGKRIINKYDYAMEKVDEKTYDNQKDVEDTCRAMISSYNSDKLIYEQYKDSTDAEERGWANSAKIRANQIASTYNNYILKNSYIWKDNVPSDIYLTLAYIV